MCDQIGQGETILVKVCCVTGLLLAYYSECKQIFLLTADGP